MSTAHRYRCTYHPNDRDGYPVHADTGVLPWVQVQAANAEAAQRAAHALTGCAIAEVQRIEPEWPFAPLTPMQQRAVQAQRQALGYAL